MTRKQLAAHKRLGKQLRKLFLELEGDCRGLELHTERYGILEAINIYNTNLREWEDYVKGVAE